MVKRGAKKKKSKPRKKATTATPVVDSRTGLQRQRMKTTRIARTTGPVMLTIGPRKGGDNGPGGSTQEPFRILINSSVSPVPGSASRSSSSVTIRTSAKSQQAGGNESRITISYDPDGNIVLSSGESEEQRGSEIRISKGGGGSTAKDRSGAEIQISKGGYSSPGGSRSSHEAIQALRNDLSLLLEKIGGKSTSSSSSALPPTLPSDDVKKNEPVMKTHSPKSYVGPLGEKTAVAGPKKRAAPKRRKKKQKRGKGLGKKRPRARRPQKKVARKEKKKPQKRRGRKLTAQNSPRSKGHSTTVAGSKGSPGSGAARSKGSPRSGAPRSKGQGSGVAQSKGKEDMYSIRESKHIERRRQIRTPVFQTPTRTSAHRSLRESDEQHRDLRQSDHGHPVGPTLKEGSKEVYQKAPRPAPNKVRYSKNRPTSSGTLSTPMTKMSSTTAGTARSKATAGSATRKVTSAGGQEQKPSTDTSRSAESKKNTIQDEQGQEKATVEEKEKTESDQDKPAEDDAEETQATTKGTVGPGGVRKAPTTNAALMQKEVPAANRIQFFQRDNQTQGNKPQSKKPSQKDVQQHVPDG